MPRVPRRTPAYIAWLLPAGTLFFLCGILLGRSTEGWIPALIALALSLAAAFISCRWRRSAAVLTAALSLGMLLGGAAYHPPLPAEGEYVLRGTVVQAVAVQEDGQVQTVLSGVTLDGVPQPDAYWTYYLSEEEAAPVWLAPGAQVELTAQVYHPAGRDNPGGFDFREYLLQRNIRYGVYGADGLTSIDAGFSLRGWVAAFRHDLSLRLMDVMGGEAGAYAAAMLLGTRDFIPEDDRAAFNELGIAHILSVSGYHVGVLAAMLALLMRPIPLARKARFALEAAVLAAYCLLTGGNAPVIRAALLLLWREFTRVQHRQVLPLHMLCITALVQLIFNPTQLTSPSFQLTYGAMLGLLLVYPWVRQRRTFRTRWAQKLWEAFAASLAAQIGILMPQLYWFGELPLMSIALNMAVMALASGLMLLYWAALFSLPIPGVRTLLGGVAAGATGAMLSCVRTLASWNFTTLWTRQADIFTFAGWALLIFGLSAFVPRKLARHRRTLLLTGTALVMLILVPLPQRSVTYTMFSVDNADAAVLQDGDMTVVIDTGEDGQALASYLHQRRQSVETLIITHLHSDHAGGVRALIDTGIPVEVCYLPVRAEIPVIDEEVLPLMEELRQTGTEFRYLHRGDVITLPSGSLTTLWPEAGRIFALHDANDVNLVFHADIAGVTLLLTSDLTGAYEKYVAMPADILKVAHHGSTSSTSAEFLAAVEPQVLLLSNALESRELRMAELAGDIPLYSTEKAGGVTIRFLGDGRFTVETVK